MTVKQSALARIFSRPSYLSLLVASLAAFVVPTILAQDNWDGGGADDNFSTDLNWVDDIAPASGVIRFEGATRLTPNNDLTAGTSFGEIQFINNGTAGKTDSFTLSGNNITLNAAIRTTTSTVAIEDDVQLDIFLNNNRSLLTFGSHDLKVSGDISGATRRITIGDNNSTNSEGLVTLSGNNTHNQTLVGRNGQLRIESDTAIGNNMIVGRNTDVFLANGLTINPTNGIDFQNSANSHIIRIEDAGTTAATIASEVDVQISGTANSRTASFTVGADDTLTITGKLTSNNTNLAKRLLKGGVGTLVLTNGTNDYEGILRADSGTVELQHSLALQVASLEMNGASIVFDDATVANSATVGALSGSSALSLETSTGGALALTLDTELIGRTYAGVLSDNGAGGGSLIKEGALIQILSGTSTYGGTTTINDGTVQLGGTAGALAGTTGITVTSPGTLLLNRSNEFTQATDLNNQAITGTGSVSKGNTGTATLSAANTYTGPTTVSAGELSVTGSVTSDVTVSAAATISGEGDLGDLTLAAGSNISIVTTGSDEFTVGTLLASGANVVVDLASGVDHVVVNYTTYDATNFATDFVAPPGGTLSNDVANSRILVSFRAPDARTWEGADVTNPTFWDISTAENWAEGDKLFYDLDTVTFSDTGVGTVDVQSSVAPATVTYSNTGGNDYIVNDITADVETISATTGGINVTGAGDVALDVKVTGATDITHSGTGILTLGGGGVSNDFVGNIVVNGGGTLTHNSTLNNDITAFGDFGNTITISNGSTLDINSNGGTNQGLKGYGTGSIIVSGTGVGGLGAIQNTGTVNDGREAFGDELAFAGDTTVSVNMRTDIDGAISTVGAGGYTITKTGSALWIMAQNNSAALIDEWIVNQGLFLLNNNNAAGTAKITVNDTGVLSIGGGRNIANETVIDGDPNAGIVNQNANTAATHSGSIAFNSTDGKIDPNASNKTIVIDGTVTSLDNTIVTRIGNGVTRITANADLSGHTGILNLYENGSILRLEDGVTLTNNLRFDDNGNDKALQLESGATAGTASGNIEILETVSNTNIQPLSGTLTVSGIISGDGTGINKLGAGTVILNNVNTYTGDTTVGDGILTLASGGRLTFAPAANTVTNQILGTGTLNLEGEMFIDFSGTDTTLGLERTWELVTVGTLTETFGATFTVNSSAGAFSQTADVWTLSDSGNTWTFTESTGILALQTPYAAWADGFTFAGAGSPDLDDGDDGLVSLLEYAFGTNPTVSDANALTVVGDVFTVGTPAVDTTFGPLSVKARFIRLVDYTNSGITYTAQFSNDLSFWQDVDGSTGVRVPGTSAQGDYEAVEVDYPLFLTNGQKAQFFRLSIDEVNTGPINP